MQDHADQEWKFARSKLWMSYFDPGSTLPAPFNLIISPKAIFYFMRTVKNCLQYICYRRSRKRSDKRRSFAMEKGALQGGLPCRMSQSSRYAEVMRRLVSRYIHQTKKQHRQDGVNEDDLLEIKQDISSLRYELREDRKRETARAYGQMDSIKKDILRLLKQSGRMSSRSGNGRESEGAVGGVSANPVVLATVAAPCPACAHIPAAVGLTNTSHPSLGTPGIIQQHSVDLGMLGRDPSSGAVDITVTPASSLPCNLTYSQGNLTGCLLAPQEMDYLRKEIVSSLRSELRELLREALARALTPTTTMAPQYYSPTTTPNPTPQYATTPTAQTAQMAAPQFPLPPVAQQKQCGQCPPASGPQYSPPSPTSQPPQHPHLRVTTSLSDPVSQRSSSGPQTSPRSSPVPQSSPGSSPIPPPCQRSNSSCGLIQRSQGSSQSGGSSKSSTNQVLLRPPNESDRVHTHMYTQL